MIIDIIQMYNSISLILYSQAFSISLRSIRWRWNLIIAEKLLTFKYPSVTRQVQNLWQVSHIMIGLHILSANVELIYAYSKWFSTWNLWMAFSERSKDRNSGNTAISLTVNSLIPFKDKSSFKINPGSHNAFEYPILKSTIHAWVNLLTSWNEAFVHPFLLSR